MGDFLEVRGLRLLLGFGLRVIVSLELDFVIGVLFVFLTEERPVLGFSVSLSFDKSLAKFTEVLQSNLATFGALLGFG